METTSTAAEYRVRLSYRNTYGDRKGITTIVDAINEKAAVIAARARIDELYAVTGARLEKVEAA